VNISILTAEDMQLAFVDFEFLMSLHRAITGSRYRHIDITNTKMITCSLWYSTSSTNIVLTELAFRVGHFDVDI